MSNTTQHLPTPYEVAGHYIRTARSIRAEGALDGQMVAELDHCDPKWRATAAFIVRVCNSHGPLVAALRNLIAASDAYSTVHAPDGDDAARMMKYAAALDKARAVMAALEV